MSDACDLRLLGLSDDRGAEAAASDCEAGTSRRRRLNILFPGRECSPSRRLRPRSASVPALGAQGLRRREKRPSPLLPHRGTSMWIRPRPARSDNTLLCRRHDAAVCAADHADDPNPAARVWNIRVYHPFSSEAALCGLWRRRSVWR